ncbi:hormogonium polysaccharide biosynthesis protein HpsL [Spirulina subsalsa]|uniref:hormogonium polysaccharide biosynthesis protein HpsL n=1 Tax=Spirulina subsalsa TaxID=54311 RepID=UPI0002DF8E8A|nr:hormogonium polysaccharide biosynthesis protein HpsL [Spirulina subsalsa]
MPKQKAKKKKKPQQKKGKKPASQIILDPKEKAAQKRKAKQAKDKLMKTIGISVACFIIFGVPLSFILEPKLGLVMGAGIPTLYVCYVYPRAALWFFVIYTPFSGTVQYQIMGGNAIFALAKDAFYMPALLGLIQASRKEKKSIFVSKELVKPLLFVFVCSILTLLVVNGSMQFSPPCHSLPRGGQGMVCRDGIPFAQGILGIKVLLGYVPLIFCTYYLVTNKKELLWVGRLHVILAIVCCGLGVVQYMMLYLGICEGTRNAVGADLFKASIDAKCLIGGSLTYSPQQAQIRLPGTLPSPWHWAWFLISNSAISFTTAFSDPSVIWKIIGLLSMALVFVNSVISGQRIALALVPVVTVILLILTGQVAQIKKFLPIGVGLAIVLSIAITLNPELVEERIESFQGRAEASPPHEFIEEQFHWAITQQRGFLGRGMGKATNSTRVFGHAELVETYHPKILYEMGWIGLFAYMFFLFTLAWVTFKSYRACKDPVIRSFGSSLWVFILIITIFPYWYPLDTDPVCVYYWFFAGIVIKAPIIDKEERARLKALQEQELELLLQAEKRKKERFLKDAQTS